MHLGGVTLLLEGTLRAPHLTAGFWTKKEKNHLALKERGCGSLAGNTVVGFAKLLPDLPRSDSTEADTKEILNETAAIFDWRNPFYGCELESG